MLQICPFERKTRRANERGSKRGDCTCIYHNCSFEGAEKPISGANPACQVSIAHLREFCNYNFGLRFHQKPGARTSLVGAGAVWMSGGDASPFVSPDPWGSCAAALVRRISASVALALREPKVCISRESKSIIEKKEPPPNWSLI